jgi:hypothetical protein
MRNLFFLVLLVAALIVGGYVVHKTMMANRDYAPAAAEDTELAAQPTPDVPPPAPATAPPSKVDANATLPAGPIPYDQLKKGDPVPATPGETPKNNSNDKAIFY